MRALRILVERHIEYMVESSMEKALKRTKGICLQIFRMGSNPVISGWRDPVRDREEVEEVEEGGC